MDRSHIQYCDGSGWQSLSGGGATLNGITAATGNQAGIANGAYTIQWNWGTLAGGSALKLASTSTAAASNAQKMLEIALSGTNSTSAQTTYGAYISNTHAGTTSTNVGLYATASGGTMANYAAIFANGNVGIGTTAPGAKADINGGVRIGYNSGTCTSTNNGEIRYNSASPAWAYCNGSAWTPFENCVVGRYWTQQTGSGSRSWNSVASSSDGTKLVATVYGGQIYTSTNSGVAWTARDSNCNWQSVASSSSRIRNHHREETQSLRSNESTAINLHYHAIKRIDGAEQRALHEFDVRRGSLMGRAAELVKGGRHFDRERDDIKLRHESDRLKQHRDLEALNERQFTIAQQTRLRQAHERKAIYDRHLDERRDLGKTQEAARPRQIEDRKQAFAKAAEIAQAHKHDRAQKRSAGKAAQCPPDPIPGRGVASCRPPAKKSPTP